MRFSRPGRSEKFRPTKHSRFNLESLFAEGKWRGVSHSKRREAVVRFLKRRFLIRERISPSHSVSHHINGARVVLWYAKKRCMGGNQRNIAELAYLLHDIRKGSPKHARASASEALKLLENRVSPADASLIEFAISSHNAPLPFKNPKEILLAANNAVIFADRMEILGAYGTMRVSSFVGESLKDSQFKRKNAVVNAIVKEAEDQLKYSQNIGIYRRGAPHKTLSHKKYFPKEVLGPYNQGLREMKSFVLALKAKKSWALEIAEHFSAVGRQGKKDLNQLIRGFRPKSQRAKQFKQKALSYISGKF